MCFYSTIIVSKLSINKVFVLVFIFHPPKSQILFRIQCSPPHLWLVPFSLVTKKCFFESLYLVGFLTDIAITQKGLGPSLFLHFLADKKKKKKKIRTFVSCFSSSTLL